MDDVLAVVGSIRFADVYALAQARELIEGVLERRRPDVVISGGAPGIDQLAAEVARRRGVEVRELLPVKQQWEPDGFRDRNELIAQQCTRLLRIVCRWATTYGSGFTHDLAAAQGKKCWSVRLPTHVDRGTVRVTYGRATAVDLPVAGGRVGVVPPLARDMGWTEKDADELIGRLTKAKYPVRWIPAQ